MQINIEIGTVITICVLAVTATVWIGKQLDGIRREIQSLRNDFVNDKTCRERRALCPCVQQLKKINEAVEDLENKR